MTPLTTSAPRGEHTSSATRAPRGDSLDATWCGFLHTLSEDIHRVARAVPTEVGLTVRGESVWNGFIQLEPNRSLPRYAMDGDTLDDTANPRIERFVRAHHHAAFFGIVADRIADAQTLRTRAVVDFRQTLLRAWEDTLTDALGDRARARGCITRDLRAWRVGLRRERRAFERGSVEPEEYFQTVIARLRWVSTSARAMLSVNASIERVGAFERACDLFLFACQCRDDALDQDEDRRCRGASVPELLGVTPGALVRAGTTCASRAAEEASRGGFTGFAAWLREFAREADVWWPDEGRYAQAFGGMLVTTGVSFNEGRSDV